MLKSKGILIIGILLITCISTLAIVFGLSSSDVLGTNKRPLTIKTESAEKEYDGTSLSAEKYSITDGSLKKGHTMTVTFVNNITNAGTIKNAISVNIIDSENVDVTGDYDITVNEGTLAILTRDITVSSETIEKDFDGQVIDYKKASVSDDTPLVSGDSISYSFIDYVQKLGETENSFTAIITNADGKDVTKNYNIKYNYGDIVLDPCEISIKTESITKEFDGETLSSDYYEVVSNTKIPNGLELIIDYNPDITTVGETENKFTIRIIDSISREDMTGFFDVDFRNGLLKIEKRKIKINIDGINTTFDGKTHSSTDIDVVSGDWLSDKFEFKIVDYPTITEVGSISNDVVVDVYLKGGDKVTDYFDIEYVPNKLTLTQCDVHITTPNETREYNGKPLTNDNYTNKTTLPEGFKLSIVTLPEITEVGSVENKITFKVISTDTTDEHDYTNNFNIKYDITGKLTIEKLKLEISTGDTTQSYDGTRITDGTCYVSKGTLPTGFSLVYDTDPANLPGRLEVGETENKITYSIVYNNGETTIPVMDYCDITDNPGKITITKRDIYITTKNCSKIYDGEKIVNYVMNEDFKNVDIATGDEIVVTSKDYYVDVCDNIENKYVVSVKNTASGDDVSENYNIHYTYGKLTIEKRQINIKTNSNTKVYDGTPLIGRDTSDPDDLGFTVTSGTLLSGDEFAISADPSITDVGTLKNILSVSIVDSTTNEPQSYYKIEVTYGELKVTQREITISSLSASKEEDETPLTCHNYVLSSATPLASGEEISEVVFSPNATITAVGSVKNTITDVKFVKSADSSDVSATNYKITYDYGTLTITAAPTPTVDPNAITVRPKDIKVKYESSATTASWSATDYDGYYKCSDGDIVINSTYTSSEYYYTATVVGTQTGVGTSYSEITSFTLYKYNSETSTYEEQTDKTFTYQTGKLQVYYDTISINVAGASRAYNGSALTNNGSTALSGTYGESSTALGTPTESSGNIHKYTNVTLNNDSGTGTYSIVVIINGSQKAVGSSQNTCTVQVFNSSNVDVTDNYNIVKSLGLLRVSKIAITITADSATVVVGTGTTLTCDSYTITGTLPDGDIENVTVVGEISTEQPGTTLNNITEAYITRNGITVDYYNITCISGTLSVTAS